MANRLFALAVAGAIGTLSRYGLAALVYRWCGGAFPWGTLVVNVLGCFLFGIVWALAETQQVIDANTCVILLTGFMGSFTTFSTFAFETYLYVEGSEWWLVVANVGAELFIGLAAVAGGLALARWLLTFTQS